MECAVITTYRCNARCQMCNIWENPTRPAQEFQPKILEKLPGGLIRLNITGGEPTLRKDIEEIAEILDEKTGRLEISTNGYFTNRLVRLAQKIPNITVRVSVEGLPRRNDNLRGIKNGFDHALRTILRLQDMGIQDIGFAMVISDRNAAELLDLYQLTSTLGIEFANATMHNSFYFHKHDNAIRDVDMTVHEMQRFIEALLRSKRSNIRLRVKDWFRAYINLGLLRYIQGEERLLPCRAATDGFCVDPFGRILACNGSAAPMVMGNLNEQSYEEIWHSPQANEVRRQVAQCTRNCWMTGSAVPAMRRKIWVPAHWVLMNKLSLALNKDIWHSSGNSNSADLGQDL